MNQGRIWTVVSPSVGLPLIIGGAAVTALLVHAAVLTHTTWFSAYWNGGAKAKVAESSYTPSVSQLDTKGYAVSVAPVQSASGATSFVATVTPSNTADRSVAMVTPDTK